jgi:hypothetical protein
MVDLVNIGTSCTPDHKMNTLVLFPQFQHTSNHILDLNRNTLKEICLIKSHSQLLEHTSNMYKKIKYACKYRFYSFIEYYVTNLLHQNYVLQCACYYGDMYLVKWATSRCLFYLDITSAINHCIACNHTEIGSYLYALNKQQVGFYIKTRQYTRDCYDNGYFDFCDNRNHVRNIVIDACIYNDLDTISRTIHIQTMHFPYKQAFKYACRYNRVNIVKVLSSLVDSIQEGFLIACSRGHLETVQEIVEDYPPLARALLLQGLVCAHVKSRTSVLEYLCSTLNIDDYVSIIVNHFWKSKQEFDSMLCNMADSVGGCVRESLFYSDGELYKNINPLVFLKALCGGPYDICKCIIDNKIVIPCHDWETLMHESMRGEDLSLLLLVIDHVKMHYKDEFDFEHVFISVLSRNTKFKNTRIIIEALEPHVSVHHCLQSRSINRVFKYGKLECVKYCMEKGYSDLLNIFTCACLVGNFHVVEYMYNMLQDSNKQTLEEQVKTCLLDTHIGTCNQRTIEFLIKRFPQYLQLAIDKAVACQKSHLSRYLCGIRAGLIKD